MSENYVYVGYGPNGCFEYDPIGGERKKIGRDRLMSLMFSQPGHVAYLLEHPVSVNPFNWEQDGYPFLNILRSLVKARIKHPVCILDDDGVYSTYNSAQEALRDMEQMTHG